MLILTIKTDQTTAEVGLYEDEQRLAYEAWEAHRELSVTVHTKIQELLTKNTKKLGAIFRESSFLKVLVVLQASLV